MLRPRPLFRHPIALLVVALALGACDNGTFGPQQLPPTGRRLAVGELTACALDTIGKVYCWGTNSTRWEYGADPSILPSSSTPTLVPVPSLSALGSGVGQHMCGILQTHHAICWGRGQSGQIGGGTLGALGNPATAVASVGQGWTDIVVGRLTTCGVTVRSDAFCWGGNQRGEIGNASIVQGSFTGTPTPVDLTPIVFKSIVTGWLHACGIATTGAAYCWGDNSSGQLGIGSVDADAHSTPLLVSPIERFAQLSLSARSTCGITVDHRALCWGLNGFGQLGDGTNFRRSVPTAVAGTVKFTAIALGSGFAGGTDAALPNVGLQGALTHTCAIAESGQPYCWGWNGAGQVGDSTKTDKFVPTPVAGGLHVTSIALGGSSTCAMNGNTIWCWGSNFVGQLGNGTKTNSSVPVRVLPPFDRP